jgi:hypothetical protein
MHARYPADDEIACLYSLALLGTGRPGVSNTRNAMQAAAIAQGIFQRNPKHPGAAHYIIHSFDDPDHAILSLTAAREYSKIAPSAAHALHMPSHIFVQLGLWDDVIASNTVAYKAAVSSRKRRSCRADARTSTRCRGCSTAISRKASSPKRRNASTRRRPWPTRTRAERPRRLRVDEGASGGRNGEVGEAWPADRSGEGRRRPRLRRQRRLRAGGRTERRKAGATPRPRRRPSTSSRRCARRPSRAPTPIAPSRSRSWRRKSAAALAVAQKDTAGAEKLLKEATAIELTLDAPSGPADPIKPSFELYGELLIDLGRLQEAAGAVPAVARPDAESASLCAGASEDCAGTLVAGAAAIVVFGGAMKRLLVALTVATLGGAALHGAGNSLDDAPDDRALPQLGARQRRADLTRWLALVYTRQAVNQQEDKWESRCGS